MHTGQRNQFRIRISNDAYEKGLRLKHFGEVLYNMIMDEFDAVVDKCEVTLVTDPVKAEKILKEEAMPAYDAPRRPSGLHDRRERGHVLHLHAVPVLRAQPLLRGHARSAWACAARFPGWTPRPPTSSTPPAPASPISQGPAAPTSAPARTTTVNEADGPRPPRARWSTVSAVLHPARTP